MSNWIYRLDLKDLWKARKENNVTIIEMGKKIAERIKRLPCYNQFEDELEDIVADFEDLEENVEMFDEVLSRLYDWADQPLSTPRGQMQRKVCWIATF